MTIKPPLFSIVTITRNNCSGLAKTYGSLSAQTFGNYEWIVVDGASTDQTLSFLSQEGLSDHCISEPDNGIYDAMNKGVLRAQGDYILFLNAGDRLSDPDILSLAEKHIALKAPDFLYGDSLEDSGGVFLQKKARPHQNIARGMFTCHQAMMYKRSLFLHERFNPDFKIAGDYDLTARLLKQCKNIDYIPAALCIFESGGVSQINASAGRHEECRSKISNGICSPVKAYSIYALQFLSMELKTHMPRVYWWFRSR